MISRVRRMLLAGMGSAAGLAMLPSSARSANGRWPPYGSSIVIDGLGGPGGIATDEGAALTAAEVNDVRSSGMTCLHMTVGEVGNMPAGEAYQKAVASIARWEAEIDRYPSVFQRVRAVADIHAAKSAGRTGLMYGFQDGVCFETELGRLETFHQLGIRVIQPTYNRRNRLGDGCMEPSDAGLSATGREAIERMNALGILVDLSHCGRATTADAIRTSSRPVAFTHTGCAALADHPRNRTDAELRAVADTGGVIGIYVMPYLSDGVQPTAADVVRHIDHAVKIAGEDHVSIGTDGGLSAVELTPEFRASFAANVARRRAAGIAAPQESETGYLFAADLNTPRRFELLAEKLNELGYSDQRIEKILGANLLRVFGAVWTDASPQARRTKTDHH
jgi:membrane dipeptidase